MRHIAIFIGGPLDEQRREISDPFPVYRVPVKDRLTPVFTDSQASPEAVQFGILEYRRVREVMGDAERQYWIYEVDL